MPRGRAIRSKAQWRALWAKQGRGEISSRTMHKLVRESRPYARLSGTVEEHRLDTEHDLRVAAGALETMHMSLLRNDCNQALVSLLRANGARKVAETDNAWGQRMYDTGRLSNAVADAIVHFKRKCLR